MISYIGVLRKDTGNQFVQEYLSKIKENAIKPINKGGAKCCMFCLFFKGASAPMKRSVKFINSIKNQ